MPGGDGLHEDEMEETVVDFTVRQGFPGRLAIAEGRACRGFGQTGQAGAGKNMPGQLVAVCPRGKVRGHVYNHEYERQQK